MLTDHGAYGFRCASEQGKAAVAFSSDDRRFRLVLSLPGSEAPSSGRAGSPLAQDGTPPGSRTAQEVARRRWRQLSSLIRAKLEAVDSGIVTFDEEFFAYMVMPGGGTVFEASWPGIAAAYAADGGTHE
jgi:hypothetical protein